MTITILFLASNPDNSSRLKLDEEIRAITRKIRASGHPEALNLEPIWAARPDDLLQALLDHQPQIVHFSGHGSQAGEIILMDKNRRGQPVSAEALHTLFTTLKDNIRVVTLNACYSQHQAAAIAEVIDCVIGMSRAVKDDTATTFAASFYRAIGFGRSVAQAFDIGKAAIQLEGLSGADAPQLLVREGIDPSALFLLNALPGTPPDGQPEPPHEPDIHQKRALIEALLACDTVRDRETRNTIVDELPEAIRSTIKRHPADRVDVANIVNRCLAFPGGLTTLIEQVRFYEGANAAMQRVDETIRQFRSNPHEDPGYRVGGSSC